MGITYTSNNITFSDVKQVPLVWGGAMGRFENGDFSDIIEYGDPVETIINAVEIDWNGAVVGENKTLNTTGEVLSRYKVAI